MIDKIKAYSLTQAARVIGITEQTARRCCEAGHLKHKKMVGAKGGVRYLAVHERGGADVVPTR